MVEGFGVVQLESQNSKSGTVYEWRSLCLYVSTDESSNAQSMFQLDEFISFKVFPSLQQITHFSPAVPIGDR
jgi:hypothetical protein